MNAKPEESKEFQEELIVLLGFVAYGLAEVASTNSKRVPPFAGMALELIYSFWPSDWSPNFRSAVPVLLGGRFDSASQEAVIHRFETGFAKYILIHTQMQIAARDRAEMRLAIEQTRQMMEGANPAIHASVSTASVRQRQIQAMREFDRMLGLAS